MKITKEEWAIRENDNGLLAIPIEDGLIISATRPENQVGLTPEQAQLIASAPDLYEALKELRVIYANLIDSSRPLDFWVKVDKALAKAEGK